MKDDKRTLTPRLRFPEFRDEPAWEVATLGDVCDMRAGKFVAATEIAEPPGDSLFPCYGGNGLRGYTKSFTHDGKYALIGRQGALCGNVRLFDGKFRATEHALVVTPSDGINTEWLYYALGLLELNRYSIGQAQPGLSVQVLEKVSIVRPLDAAEQQKIADCLTSLDAVVAAQGRKVAALKAHKKGLMQQIFPREGETLPRLRFPEFRSHDGWDSRMIGELGDVLMCRRILANQTNPLEGIPFYKIGTLGGIPDAYISKELYDEYRERFSFPRKGEVLITCAGTVGKCVPYDGIDAYYQDSNIVWIDNPKEDVSNQFLFFLLVAVDWSKLNSTTITRIYLDDLRTLLVKIPRRKEEQHRIADCLSTLDARIAAEMDKLAALKTHKRGLMQQLFPSPEDALTGS